MADDGARQKKHVNPTLATILVLAIFLGGDAPPETVAPLDAQLGRLTAPPTIDGRLEESEWAGATRLELKYQVEPGDKSPSSERTEVWLAADRERLYVAFRAYDSDASAIRARVARRDDVGQDDFVSLLLDTCDDRQRAYRLLFNPFARF